MPKSYKQLYEETKAQLDKLREQEQPDTIVTDDELFALRAVAYGCNTNPKLHRAYGASFLDRGTNKTVSFEDALVTVYELIARLAKEAT